MQDHHILPKATPEFKEIFKRAEISIDDAINRILLPDAAGKTLYPTKKTMHSGRHVRESYVHLVKEAKDGMFRGELSNWTSIKYREEINKIINAERPILQKGERVLNSAQTLLEKVKDANSK